MRQDMCDRGVIKFAEEIGLRIKAAFGGRKQEGYVLVVWYLGQLQGTVLDHNWNLAALTDWGEPPSIKKLWVIGAKTASHLLL